MLRDEGEQTAEHCHSLSTHRVLIGQGLQLAGYHVNVCHQDLKRARWLGYYIFCNSTLYRSIILFADGPDQNGTLSSGQSSIRISERSILHVQSLGCVNVNDDALTGRRCRNPIT